MSPADLALRLLISPAAAGEPWTALTEPTRIALSSDGTLLVTDTRAGDLASGTLAEGITRRVHLGGRPFGVAAAPDGRVLVGDTSEGSVRLYDHDLRPVLAFGVGVGELVRPSDVAVHDALGLVYVTDSGADLVRVYTLEGAAVRTFGGEGETALSFPTGIALLGDDVWVVSQRTRRVVRFSLEGQPISWFGSHGEEPGELFTPQGIYADTLGRIWIADARLGRISAFDPSGLPLGSLGSFGSARGELRGPSDLAIDRDGTLVVASTHAGRLERFGPESHSSFTAPPEIRVAIAPESLSPATEGPVWITVEIEGLQRELSEAELTANGLAQQSIAEGDHDRDGIPDVAASYPVGDLLQTLPREGRAVVLVKGHVAGIYVEQGVEVEITEGDPPGSLTRALSPESTRSCGCASAQPRSGAWLVWLLPLARLARRERP